MTKSVYLVGGGGVGKSSVMAELLHGWDAGPYQKWTEKEMFGHWLYRDGAGAAYLGHLRPEYPGTDALSMSVAPQAMLWLQSLPPNLDFIFGEGNRLCHVEFLSALGQVSDLLLVHLVCDPNTTELRRATRGGKQQNAHYVRGVATKAANTAAAMVGVAGVRVITVETDAVTPADIAQKVWAML